MKSRLLETIALTYAYYNHGQSVQNEVLAMYAEDLADLPVEQCIMAYGAYRRNPKNTRYPLPAQIREIINPTPDARDLAINTASRINEAVSKFGWCNPTEAKNYIGEAGWRYVNRAGGWQYLCENLGVNIQPTTFIAQCRDAVASDINLDRIGIDTDRPALEQSNVNQISDVVRKLIKSVDSPKDEE